MKGKIKKLYFLRNHVSEEIIQFQENLFLSFPFVTKENTVKWNEMKWNNDLGHWIEILKMILTQEIIDLYFKRSC